MASTAAGKQRIPKVAKVNKMKSNDKYEGAEKLLRRLS